MSASKVRGPARLSGRRLAVAVALSVVVGVAVRPWIFAFGFAADDYAQLAMMRGVYPVERHPLELFTFSDGSAEEAEALMQAGFYPWFTHPRLRLSMFRPLASALMWVDHGLFGLWAMGYHLHSLLWWVLLLAGFALLLRRLLPPVVTLLVLALFVVDETHGVMLGWIANRNAVISTGLCLLAMVAHLRYREQGRGRGPWVVLALVTLALLSGEYALCFLAYFVAYEALAAPGHALSRLRALWPVALPAAAYVLVRVAGGYGSVGSGMYVDPIRETDAFLRAGLHRYPTLVGDLTLGIRADWWTFGFPWAVDMVREGWATIDWLATPDPWRPWQEGLGVLALLLILILGLFALRWASAEQGRHLRWLGAGALVSVVPLLASFPSSRSLVVPLIGWSVVLGLFVYHGYRRGGVARVAALAVLSFHLVVPVLHTWKETRDMAKASELVRQVILAAEVDDARLREQRIVLMSAVEPTTAIYIPSIRAIYGKTAPRSCFVMNPTGFPYTLTRAGPGRVFAELHHGTMLTGSFEAMFRSRDTPRTRFQKFILDGYTVTLLDMRDGGPYKVRFDFDPPIDDPSWVFLHSTAQGLQRFPMPPVGGTARVPSPVPYVSFQVE